MKRLVALVLCLLPSLALAIPPYPTVWYREQTVRNTADIRALEAATDALEESTVAHATDTDNPHGVTAGQIGALTAEEDAAALAAVAGVESNVTALAETVGGITAESLGALTAETDPAWTAASGSVVYATTPGYTAAVEQAASAYGWGDHSAAGYLTEETDTAALSAVAAVSGRVDTVEDWGDHSEAGYATTKAAGEIATNVVGAATNALLDLAGTRAMTGPLNMNTNAITKVSYVTGHTGKGLFFDDNSLDFWDSSAIFNDGGTNVWQGRVNDTEASRIAAIPAASFAQVDTNEVADATLFTPDFVGQLLIGSESNLVWVAGGATTNDWILLTVTE